MPHLSWKSLLFPLLVGLFGIYMLPYLTVQEISFTIIKEAISEELTILHQKKIDGLNPTRVVTFELAETNNPVTISVPESESGFIGLSFSGLSSHYNVTLKTVQRSFFLFPSLFPVKNTAYDLYRVRPECWGCKIQRNDGIIRVVPTDKKSPALAILESKPESFLQLVKIHSIASFIIFILLFLGAYAFQWGYLFLFKYTNSHVPGVSITTLLLFIISVSFNINGSSVSAWSGLITWDDPIQSQEIGNARLIRSDEYSVMTPLLLSQYHNGYPDINPSFGQEKSILATPYNLPVDGMYKYLTPFNYGFFLFDSVERGFSWRWNLTTFGLFLTTFYLLYILTRGKPFLSLLGGLWITYSGAVQWWFFLYPQVITTMNLILILSYLLLKSARIPIILASALGLIIAGFQYVYILYPATLILPGYLGLAILAGILLEEKEFISQFHLHIRLTSIVVGLTVLLILIYIHFSGLLSTIDLITETEYPGKRITNNANLSLATFFTGFFDRYYGEAFPSEWRGNQSEASSFILVFLFLLPLVYSFIKKREWTLLLLTVYSIAFIIYETIGFPMWLADMTLMSRVNRTILGIGVAGVYGSVVYLSRNFTGEVSNSTNKKWSYLIWIFVVTVYFHWIFQQNDPSFFVSERLITGAVAMMLLAGTLLFQKTVLFGLVLTWAIIPNFFVNPVRQGLSPLYDEKHTELLHSKIPDHGKLLFFGEPAGSHYLMASGFHLISGVKYLPEMSLFRILDPEGKYHHIYNRYAHIRFLPRNNEEVTFTLTTADAFTVSVSPCNQLLSRAGVDIVVIPYHSRHTAGTRASCLQQDQLIYHDTKTNMSFYRVRGTDDSGS